MKVLLKRKGNWGLFLWSYDKQSKLIVSKILDAYQVGQVFEDDEKVWDKEIVIDFSDYNTYSLDKAIDILKINSY